MKKKLMYSVMMVGGITLAATFCKPVFSQTDQTPFAHQMALEAHTFSDSMKTGMVPDKKGMENMRSEMINDTLGMEQMDMHMKKDSLTMKNGEMKHDTTAVKEFRMNNEHMYKEMDAKKDTTKIR